MACISFSTKVVKKEIDKPTIRSPIPICNGKPTMKTFICGTVLATNPNPTLKKNRIAIMGAAIFTAIVKVAVNKWSTYSGVMLEKFISNGLITKKLSTIA